MNNPELPARPSETGSMYYTGLTKRETFALEIYVALVGRGNGDTDQAVRCADKLLERLKQ